MKFSDTSEEKNHPYKRKRPLGDIGTKGQSVRIVSGLSPQFPVEDALESLLFVLPMFLR
jgi:hypothetical protein